MNTELICEIETVLLADALAFAETVKDQGGEGTAKPVVFGVGDGTAILMGSGRFLNRVLSLTLVPSRSEMDRLALAAKAIGRPTSVEISPLISSEALTELRRLGLSEESRTTVFVAGGQLEGPAENQDSGFGFELVDGDSCQTWLDTAAAGFGYSGSDTRRASNEFALAAFAQPEVDLILVRLDGTPIATSSVSCRGEIAILGGMSTVEGFRGRGAQSASIRYRLALARSRGCRMAISTAASGRTSARNLASNGMTKAYELITYSR